jgi:hypothetical protein
VEQRVLKGLFVSVMLALGVAVLFRWHADSGSAGLWFQSVHDAASTDPAASWPPASKQQKQHINAAIRAQLEALHRHDLVTAARYQVPPGSSGATNPMQMMSMIRNEPLLANFTKVTFGECRVDNQAMDAVSNVTLVGEDGSILNARYTMLRINGVYRIAYVGGPAS